MPNFNTHWLVAIQCRDTTPIYIRKGYEQFRAATTKFRTDLYRRLDAIKPIGKKDNTEEKFYAFRKKGFDKLCQVYEDDLKHPSRYDDITCFSAYMLGACGPDLWTTPSAHKWSTPDVAGIHFDLGHYNRTHRQFQVAIVRWKQNSARKRNFTKSLQYKVEVSYFLGMASHIATDLILHQLVNVYAGAYNLLEKEWESEHGALSILKNLWNTHNKVEHFWDSYLRYRYLGDYGPLWPSTDKTSILPPLGFPVAASLLRKITERKPFDAQSQMKKWLKKESTKLKIEKCFIFPRIACDRICAGSVAFFVYDTVVDKQKGAYPAREIFNQAVNEASGYQMIFNGRKSERRKLAYFISGNNTNTNICSYNYLNYYVCPNLDRTKKYGNRIFYHLKPFASFINSSTLVSRSFITRLLVAMGKLDPANIGPVDHFWNLDTGQGLKISKVVSDTTKEVITELDFVHICDFLKSARITYRGYDANLECMTKGKSRKVKSFDTIEYPFPPVMAFKTYHSQQKFSHIDNVYEQNSKKKSYLEKIVLQNKVSLESLVKLDTFFKPAKQTSVKKQLAGTTSIKEKTDIVVADQKYRLTLRFITGIVPFRTNDKLGFYLLGDKLKGIRDSAKYAEGRQKKWLKNHKTQALTLLHKSTKPNDRLAKFKTHMLINLEKEKNLGRKIAKGEWNNVVQYASSSGGFINHNGHYGRNYAIATGRENVLHPDGDGNFWADKDFKYFKDVSPTEHIFFTLYLLVKTENGCYDLINKEKITEKELTAITKIDCLGFVKIVLFYVLDKNGASQVETCYVDGLEVPVTTKWK